MRVATTTLFNISTSGLQKHISDQAKLQEQTKNLYGENSPMSKDMWTQFLNFQGPAMQGMMGTYMEQSKRMFAQMQEQINSQTRNMFTGFPFPGSDEADKK